MGIDSTAPKRWNLTPLANGDDDPELEAKTQVVLDKNYEFINKWKERPEYLSDPQVLREALDEYEELNSKYGTSGDAGYYWGLRLAQEQSNPQLKARYNKLEDIAHKITNDIRFFELDLSKIDQEAQNKFLKSPELIKYKHYLEVLFAQAKYLLSDAEESVLTLTSSPAYSNWTHMVSEFISDSEVEWEFEGESGHKHFSELSALMESQNKAKRDLAAEHFNKILLANVNSAEHELNSVLQYKKALDLLRGAERPDEMRHVGDDISSAVVDTMLEVVEQNFEIAHSFYELKAKLLGQKKLEYHERNVAYGEVDTEYSYDRSVEMVSKVLSQLDPELLSIFEGFLANDNIDVFPQQGKHPGAFATAALPSQPSYILLNHTDKLNDVLTLAHEVGHGINNELIRKAQHALYFDTPLSTAEVASTFMEDFVLDEILKDADDELKLAII